MDEDEIFQDCESSDTISPLKELKEWIENYEKFPENIRKLKKNQSYQTTCKTLFAFSQLTSFWRDF